MTIHVFAYITATHDIRQHVDNYSIFTHLNTKVVICQRPNKTDCIEILTVKEFNLTFS